MTRRKLGSPRRLVVVDVGDVNDMATRGNVLATLLLTLLAEKYRNLLPVSYTHLTLPTKA